MFAQRLLDPQHAVGMMHAALHPLDLVEVFEERGLHLRHGALYNDVLFERSVDWAADEELLSVVVHVQGMCICGAECTELFGGSTRNGNILEVRMEVLSHDRCDGDATLHPGPPHEPLEVFGSIGHFAALFLVEKARLLG